MKTREDRREEAFRKASDKMADIVISGADVFLEYTKNYNQLVDFQDKTNLCEEELDELAYKGALDKILCKLIIFRSLDAQGYVLNDYDCRKWIKR